MLKGDESLEKDRVINMETENGDDKLYRTAELFKVFGDISRVKIMYELMKSELCVSDIASKVGMSGSAVSHQLKVLRSAYLVRYRREGKTLYYSLADDHVSTMLGQAMEHISE